ncbi:MAG: YccF domain-containing protein [Alistipes sp.]|nr:YccF domain-containing protein [Candidatus Alistipes equi]
MTTISNIIWFILGGFVIATLYFVFGIAMCLTIIGIPFGIGLFRIGSVAAFPFGKNVSLKDNAGFISTLLSVIWILFGWWEIAVVHLLLSCLFAVTIIGIPFAVQHWKLIRISCFPFLSKATNKKQ